MENDEKFDELMSSFNKERNSQNNNKEPITQEELIQRVIKRTKLSEEKVRKVFELYMKYLEELYLEDPDLLIEHLEYTFNDAIKKGYENN
jgi:hypothetical protein